MLIMRQKATRRIIATLLISASPLLLLCCYLENLLVFHRLYPEYRINVNTYEANRLNKGKNGAKWPKSGEFKEPRKIISNLSVF